MANFSGLLVKHLHELLDSKYEKIFINRVLPHNEERIECETFEEFIMEILETTFANKSRSENIREIRNNIVRNKNKMKSSWFNSFKKELKNPGDIMKTNRTIAKEMDGYLMMKDAEFKKAFDGITIDELRKNRVEEVTRWGKSKDSELTSFHYYRDKKPYQKLSSLKYDLTLAIIDIIEKNFDGTLEGFIKQRATELIENPIFGISKILLPMDTLIDEGSNSPILFNDYHVSEDYILRTIIKEPEKVKVNSHYVLDEIDSEIIDMIYSKIKPNFYRDKTIEIDIGEVVRRVYSTPNGHAYKDAENRIMKISLLQIQGLIKEKETVKDTKFNINFFDHAIIETDPLSSKRIAKIVFGEILHNRYIHNKTVRVASYQFKKMSNPLSKILFFTLQKERLEKSVSNSINIYGGEYNYLFFRHKVRFLSRKQNENMKLIDESLKEFVDEKYLIKEYVKMPDGFFIEFYPLSEEEEQYYGINPEALDDNRYYKVEIEG